MRDPVLLEATESAGHAVGQRRQGLREALTTAVANVVVVAAVIFWLWVPSSAAARGDHMTTAARIAAQFGDPKLHRSIRTSCRTHAVGIVTAASPDAYVTRRIAVRHWVLLGILPAGALITLLSIGFYRSRLRGIEAARAARRAARELVAEQQRLESVIEGTNAGTWVAHLGVRLGEGELVVDERWAATIGRTPEELNPLSAARLYSPEMMHPDDVAATRVALADYHEHEGKVLEIDVRLRHAAGHWVWVQVRGKVLERNEYGRPLRAAGTQMDISARKQIELALVESESNFRSLFELSPVGIALVEYPTGRFLQVNDALVASTGYSREELLQLTYMDITPAPWRELERRRAEVLESSTSLGVYEKEYQRKDGSRFPVLISGTRMKDAGGRDVVWSIVQDISERKALESELADAARQDKLTGLANRVLFQEWLQAAVDRVRAGEQERFAVLFLDFDRFKLVNDAMGHEAGDRLLREIAARLQSFLRGVDECFARAGSCLVARFGGDEFLVLINDLDDSTSAQRIGDLLLTSLAQAYTVRGREIYTSASIGIVTSEHCLESADAVIRNADVAMYEAKRSGRACAVMFDETMRTRLTRQVTVESNLRKSLGTPEILLVYQPIVDLVSGQMTSVEALARWQHPLMGQVSPGEFIPVAEESGLIVAFGEWVLQEACCALATWRRQDLLRAPRSISVNISRAELALGERLQRRVRAALEHADLPPDSLQLEVTEREVTRDVPTTLRLMHALRDMGVRLAMDDFGTGTSSLGGLRDYPFDVIKIDKSYVHDVARNPDVHAVIRATVTLVEHLGKMSVAEGVEEREQVAVLQSLGCHHAQGYFFSRPISAERMFALVRKGGSLNQMEGLSVN